MTTPGDPPGGVRVCLCDEAERNRRRGRRGDSRYVPVPVQVSEDGEVSCYFCWDLIQPSEARK